MLVTVAVGRLVLMFHEPSEPSTVLSHMMSAVSEASMVPDDMVIQVINRSDDDTTYLTIDGQVGELLKQNDTVVCRRSQWCVNLVTAPRMQFFDVLLGTEPALDPPGTRSSDHGLCVGKNPLFSPEDPMANSSQFVLPTSTDPAARNLAHGVQSYGGT